MVSNIGNFNYQGYAQNSLQSDSAVSVPNSPATPPQIPQQSPQQLPPMENDSVSFTTQTPAQTPAQGKKKNFVEKNWFGLLLGASAITAGVILTKGKLWGKTKPIGFEQVQKNLAEIFGKQNLSKTEAETMIQKYKEIYNIKDKDEYITKLFGQLKKDFGYENTDAHLEILTKAIDAGNIKGAAAYSFSDGKFKVVNTYSKERIFGSIPHEFDHMRQEEYMYRTSPDKLRKALAERTIAALKDTEKWKNMLDKLPLAAENFANEQMISISKRWKSRGAFSPESKEYKLGEKYIDSQKHFEKDNKNSYDNSFNEQEAHRIGDLMRDIGNYIKTM